MQASEFKSVFPLQLIVVFYPSSEQLPPSCFKFHKNCSLLLARYHLEFITLFSFQGAGSNLG